LLHRNVPTCARSVRVTNRIAPPWVSLKGIETGHPHGVVCSQRAGELLKNGITSNLRPL
jgi:hypothetical protein